MTKLHLEPKCGKHPIAYGQMAMSITHLTHRKAISGQNLSSSRDCSPGWRMKGEGNLVSANSWR